jgi:lipoyl(octanoyl) transferase
MLKTEWKIDKNPIEYEEALRFMEDRVEKIINNKASNLIWITQHPAIYTAGVSAKESELLRNNIPVFQTNRGGKYTYHGPGVKVVYVILNLKEIFAPKPPDVRLFVKMLENWIINILANFGIKGEIRDGRVGIWIKNQISENKIAAIGIKLKKWISYHGFAININPDLSAFKGIVPCGISNFGVTSIYAEKKIAPNAKEINEEIHNQYKAIFVKNTLIS